MSKAFRLKGHCNRLITICELPAHQAQIWWRFSWLVRERGLIIRMRCFLFLVFLLLPSEVIAADGATDQSATITSLAGQIQKLRTENEQLSARVTALETRLPAGNKTIGVIDCVASVGGAVVPCNPRQKQ